MGNEEKQRVINKFRNIRIFHQKNRFLFELISNLNRIIKLKD